MRVVEAEPSTSEELDAYIALVWHADFVVAHGEQIRPADLPGFIALDDDRIVGHAAYRIDADACELVAIVADPPQVGTGSALMNRVIDAARDAGCSRVWLTTTNDNLDALRFYQRRGFRLTALRTGVVVEARRTLKSDLPATGLHDIPMRDELDLELRI